MRPPEQVRERAYSEVVSVAIGLVGAGQRASGVHAPSLAAAPGVRFAGIWARSSAAAQSLAGRFGVPAYERYADLLDHCDGVSFAVPPLVQVDLASAAAMRRKAVLLEKPIAGDLTGAEELSNAVLSSGVISQVALTWRYTSAVRRFLTVSVPRTRPQGGNGRIITDTFTAGPPAAGWRLERGVLLDQGPDLVDLLDAALGHIVGVRAHGDPLGWVGLLLEHEGGRFSEASICATAKDGTNRAEVEVFGPGGAAAVDCAAAVGPDTFATMVAEFSAAIEHGTPHHLDARRGLRLQQILDNAETDLFQSA